MRSRITPEMVEKFQEILIEMQERKREAILKAFYTDSFVNVDYVLCNDIPDGSHLFERGRKYPLLKKDGVLWVKVGKEKHLLQIPTFDFIPIKEGKKAPKDMILTPFQAETLGKVFDMVYEAYSLLEGIRPGGGFGERIDKKYCKECGNEK